MREKHILILAIILLGLVTYFSIFEMFPSPEEPEDIGPPVFFLDYRDVKKIQIRTSEGEELICERKERGWDLIKGEETEKWRAKIADFVLYLLWAVEIDKIPVENSQLSYYGLENPAYWITLTDVTDKTYQLMTGDSTPVKTSVYAKFADSPNIIIIGARMAILVAPVGVMLRCAVLIAS